MREHFKAAWACAAILAAATMGAEPPATGPAVPAARPPAVPSVAKPDQMMSVDLSGATLHSVVIYIGQMTGKHIILPDRFPGDRKVDVISTGASIPARRMMEIMATILRNAGYVMIETPFQISIVPEGSTEGAPVLTDPAEGLGSQTLVTITREIKNADAAQLMPILQQIKSKAGSLQIHPDSNTLIITEYGPQLRTMLSLIDRFDTKWGSTRPEVVKLEKTSVDSLRTVVDAFVKNLGQNAEPVVKKRLATFATIAQPAINSFVLFGHPDDIARVKEFIKLVDVSPADAARTFHTYTVLNRDVGEMVTVLSNVFTAVRTSRGGEKAAEQPPTVIADPSNSAIIVIAAPDRYAEFLPLLQQLDKAKAQVMIESALVELSMDKLADLGLELSTTDLPGAGRGTRGVAGTTFDLTTISESGARVPVLPPNGGLTAAIFRDANIASIIRLSQQDQNVAFIAAPQLMASDNRPATVEIAEEREIQKAIVSPEGRTSEVTGGTFIKASIKLQITPHINQEGTVRLEIEQITEQFLPSSSGQGGLPLNNKSSRMAKTEVNVPDGSMVVIAGLTRTVQSKIIQKVPVLGNIPLLGWLFRRTQTTNEQRNLCVFITPHIFRDKATLGQTADQKKAELGKINASNAELQSDTVKDFVKPPAAPVPAPVGKETPPKR